MELLAFEQITGSLASLWTLLPEFVRGLILAVLKIVITVSLARMILRAVPRLERTVVGRATVSEARREATRSEIEHQLRIETLVRVTGSVARALIYGFAAVTVLGAVGADITPILAGAGIAGVAVGFGAQSIVKDFFAGFFILMENQFRVGDTITVGTVTGLVEEMTLRVTLVRDAQGTLHFLQNGNLGNVANRTHAWSRATLDLAVPVTVSATATRAILEGVATAARTRVTAEGVEFSEVVLEGPLDFGEKGATWRVFVRCAPEGVAVVRAALIDALHAALVLEPGATALQWAKAVEKLTPPAT